MLLDSIFPVDSSNKYGESQESSIQCSRPVFSHIVTPISEAQRIFYLESGAMCSTEGHGSLTLHKLEASLHKGLHLLSTTKNKLSAGVSKRKQQDNKETFSHFEEAWAYHFAGGNCMSVRSELRQPFGEEGVLRVYSGKKCEREIKGFLTS